METSLCLAGVFFPENVNVVVCACVALHNIYEERGHAILEDLEELPTFLVPEKEETQNPRQISTWHREEGSCMWNAVEGTLVQNAVAKFMYQHQHRSLTTAVKY